MKTEEKLEAVIEEVEKESREKKGTAHLKTQMRREIKVKVVNKR